jgi:energy-coupling factor transporter transmembrane protein EcfT
MNALWLTRLKLLGLLACSTGILLIRDIRISVALAACIVGLCFVSRVKDVMRERLISILTVCAFVLVFQFVFNSGVSLSGRLLLGFASGARILALSLLVFLFTETTSVSQIISALSFLPGSVQLMMSISFALIPAIMQETKTIRMAQQARGFRSGGFHVFGSLLPLLIPLLNRTLARAEHIGIVMQARGYEAQGI